MHDESCVFPGHLKCWRAAGLDQRASRDDRDFATPVKVQKPPGNLPALGFYLFLLVHLQYKEGLSGLPQLHVEIHRLSIDLYVHLVTHTSTLLLCPPGDTHINLVVNVMSTWWQTHQPCYHVHLITHNLLIIMFFWSHTSTLSLCPPDHTHQPCHYVLITHIDLIIMSTWSHTSTLSVCPEHTHQSYHYVHLITPINLII